MAKKMADDEIESFIKSKQVSAQDYVAPTVITGGRNQSQPTQQKTVKQSTQQTAKPTISIGMNGALQNAANKSGISFLSNAYQNIANNRVNNLANAASGVGSVLNNVKDSLVNNAKNIVKSGDSNVGMGLLNTGLDALSHYGEGWLRTLEGQADTGLYMLADQHKGNSYLANKLLGEGNFISGINDFLRQGYMDTAKHNSTADVFGTDGQNSLLENVAWLGSDFQKNLAKTTYDVTGNKDLANIFNAKSKMLYDLSQLGENGENWRSRTKDSSYLGTTGANVAEGLGNITAMAMEAAVGSEILGAAGMTTVNPATGVTELSTAGKTLMTFTNSFTSSYGNTRSTAYEQGADDTTARRAATINGLAEGLSELMFDAMPGIKSPGFLDKVGVKDILTDRLSKTFGKGVGKVFLKLAGGTEEGFEEMMSNALVALGTDLMHYIDNNYTYGMENLSGNALDDFLSQLTSQESIDSFVTSALTSTLLSAGGSALTTHQQNQIIGEYAKQNNITVNEAKQQLFSETNLQQALEQVKDAHNTVEQEGQARQNILNNVKANNYQQVVQPTQETQQPVIETETPQIQTKQETNINTQETPQSVDMSLKPTKTRTQSIIDSVNAFNLKNQEQNQQQTQQEVKTTETQGLNDNEYNEIKKRYKSLMEEIGFEEDYNKNATPSEILGQLKTIKETAFEGDGSLESARMEGAEVLKQTRSQYDKLNRLINRFENKVKVEQQEVKTPTKPKGKAMTLQELQNRLGVKETKQQKIENNAKALNLEENKKVEKNAKMVYNEAANEKGVGENEFRRIQKESRNLSKEQHETLYKGDKSGIKRVRENISRVLQPKMESIISSNNDNGKSIRNGYVETNNKDFHDIFELNQPYLRNPDTVTVYEAKDYKNNKNYLSEDGLSGFSITPDGDLISVFNNSGKPGMLLRISDLVKENAKTLDCFQNNQQKLADMYEDAFGFKTASIMDFNYDILAEEHGKEYADAFVEKYGEAPVHFMVKTNQEIETKHFNKDQYDEALEYRNSLIDKQGTSDSSFSNGTKKTDNIAEKKASEELTIKNKEVAKKVAKNLNDTIKQDKGKVQDYQTLKRNIEKETGKQMRSWVETSTKSTGTTELINNMNKEKITYEPTSNKKNMDAANRELAGLTYEQKVEKAKAILKSDKRIKSTDVALLETVIQEAQKEGKVNDFIELVQDTAILGTETGQVVQALSLIRQSDPLTQISTLQKLIEREQEKGNKVYQGVQIKEDLVEKVMSSYNEDGTFNQEQFDNAMDELKQDIADQMHVRPTEKLNTWRYLSMLGNPKTHIRNIVANVAMSGLQTAKNKVAAGLETVLPMNKLNKLLGGKETATRGKTLARSTQEVKNFTNETIDNYFKKHQTKSKYNETMGNLKGDIESRRNIFSEKTFVGKMLNKLERANSKALDIEDVVFNKAETKRAFSNFLTANGIETQADIDANPEIVAQALEYATFKGNEATFHQHSQTGTTLRNARESLRQGSNLTRIVGLGMDATLPFINTPINIAKTGIEYTPGLGMIKTFSDVMNAPKDMKADVLIDSISKQFVGGMLAAAGYALASAGYVNGKGGEEKDDKLEKNLGKQDYSLNLTINGKKHTFDLSWLSPSAMPLFTGVELYNATKGNTELSPELVMNILAKTIDPLSEMSVISSVTEALQSYSKGTQALQDIGTSAFVSYMSQYFPTLMGQVATLFDDKQRSSSGKTVTEKLINQLKYKTPGLRNTLPEQVDVWGEERKLSENPVQKALEAFFSPANRKEVKVDDTTKEIERIYDNTGAGLPSLSLTQSPKIDSDYVQLSSDEYMQYKKDYGKTSKELLDELMTLNDYKTANDSERKKMVSAIYEYSTYMARKKIADEKNIKYEYKQSDGTGYNYPKYYLSLSKEDFAKYVAKKYNEEDE